MIEIKTEKEIELMRAAGRILRAVMEETVKAAKVGVKTKDIDSVARKIIEDSGSKPLFLGYRGYPATTCISINEEIVHGIPSNRTLKNGDIVSIDIGLQKDGFCADKAVTVEIGNVSPEAKKLVETTRIALSKAIEKMRVGNRLGDVCSSIENYVMKTGYSVVREYTGHGIGRTMHEAPEVTNFGVPGTGARLQKGMIFAIEPMVNAGRYKTKVLGDGWTVVTQDGTLSAHFEDTVLITDSDPEILT